jgi:PhzF family phenazine biosynthesis protein
VFSSKPLSGNGLVVFTQAAGFSQSLMQRLTQEMRQFESIFLQPLSGNRVRAQVFTMEEELDFAGHPVLGAAAVLHELHEPGRQQAEWLFELNHKTVSVVTRQEGHAYAATMNQGQAEFGRLLNPQEHGAFLEALSLPETALYPGLPLQVVSTGLPYLLLPLQRAIGQAHIQVTDLEVRLSAVGAKFIGLLEVPTLRLRTWDNLGQVEDIATGSLAGPAGALLVRHQLHPPDQVLTLQQGEFLQRASQLLVQVVGSAAGQVLVSGQVSMVAQGTLSRHIADSTDAW